MALLKAKKSEIVEKFKDIVDGAASIVFLHSKGISVNDTNQLREQLRKEGAGYNVAKKTLLTRVLSDSSITGDMPKISGGELSVAYSTDLIVPAREIFAFKKKYNDKVTVVGGVFDGKYMTAAEMQSIAEIPAPQVLRGMFVNVINSPIQGLVIALSKIAEQKA